MLSKNINQSILVVLISVLALMIGDLSLAFGASERFIKVGKTVNAYYRGAKAVRLTDGNVLIVAYGQGDSSVLRTVQPVEGYAELYNPKAKSFANIRPPAPSRYPNSFELILLANGQVLKLGGESVELYNPTDRAFHQIAPMWIPRANAGVARLKDGKILVVGGYTLAQLTKQPIQELEKVPSIASKAIVENDHRLGPVVFVPNANDTLPLAEQFAHTGQNHLRSKEAIQAKLAEEKAKALIQQKRIEANLAIAKQTLQAEVFDPGTEAFSLAGKIESVSSITRPSAITTSTGEVLIISSGIWAYDAQRETFKPLKAVFEKKAIPLSGLYWMGLCWFWKRPMIIRFRLVFMILPSKLLPIQAQCLSGMDTRSLAHSMPLPYAMAEC